MTESEPLQVAVVGVGRMGRHHARTYSQIPDCKLVAVVDQNEDRAEELAEDYGCAALLTTDQLIEKFPGVRAVSVAVPTRFHVEAAIALLERGVACLIEKPLAESSEHARRLADLSEKHAVTLQVGHTERFNPAVRAVAAMNLTPRFIEIDRVSPMTFRSLDVGVVMDMMIHDLDIVLTLAGCPLVKVDAVGVAVLGEHEDVCDARLVFESGCVATLTGSRLAMKTERKLRMFSETGYVSLDYAKRSGLVIRKSDNDSALSDIREKLRAGADLSDLDFGDLISIDELAMDQGDDASSEADPLTAQLTSFLQAVRDGSEPVVTAAQGVAAIEAAERVLKAIASHRWKGLDD